MSSAPGAAAAPGADTSVLADPVAIGGSAHLLAHPSKQSTQAVDDEIAAVQAQIATLERELQAKLELEADMSQLDLDRSQQQHSRVDSQPAADTAEDAATCEDSHSSQSQLVQGAEPQESAADTEIPVQEQPAARRVPSSHGHVLRTPSATPAGQQPMSRSFLGRSRILEEPRTNPPTMAETSALGASTLFPPTPKQQQRAGASSSSAFPATVRGASHSTQHTHSTSVSAVDRMDASAIDHYGNNVSRRGPTATREGAHRALNRSVRGPGPNSQSHSAADSVSKLDRPNMDEAPKINRVKKRYNDPHWRRLQQRYRDPHGATSVHNPMAICQTLVEEAVMPPPPPLTAPYVRDGGGPDGVGYHDTTRFSKWEQFQPMKVPLSAIGNPALNTGTKLSHDPLDWKLQRHFETNFGAGPTAGFHLKVEGA